MRLDIRVITAKELLRPFDGVGNLGRRIDGHLHHDGFAGDGGFGRDDERRGSHGDDAAVQDGRGSDVDGRARLAEDEIDIAVGRDIADDADGGDARIDGHAASGVFKLVGDDDLLERIRCAGRPQSDGQILLQRERTVVADVHGNDEVAWQGVELVAFSTGDLDLRVDGRRENGRQHDECGD